MIYAQIHNYTDIAGVAQQTLASRLDQPDATWLPYNVPDVTWLSLVAGVIVVATVAPVIPVSVPQSLTPRQIRLVLTAVGLRTAVEAAVTNSTQDIKDMWQYSQVFLRNAPILNKMTATLGITSAQVDTLFIQGATL